MPRPKTGRVQVKVRLLPSDIRFVDEVAKAANESRAQILGGIFDEALPVLRQQYEAMKVVASSPERAAEVIAKFAEEARQQIAQAEMGFDAGVVPVAVKRKGAVRGRARG